MVERFVRWCVLKRRNWWGLGALFGAICAVVIGAIVVYVKTKEIGPPIVIILAMMAVLLLVLGVILVAAAHYEIPITLTPPSRTNDKEGFDGR